MEFQTVAEISPSDLSQRLKNGEDIVILDVREAHELAVCSLLNTVHIPLGQLAYKLEQMQPYKDREIAVYCRSGKRSERAALFLLESGFKNVSNLKGGILAWADEVDPSLAKY